MPRRWKKAPNEPARIATTEEGVSEGRDAGPLGVPLEDEHQHARQGVEEDGRDEEGDDPSPQM
jgi:hypothetical protein